MRRKGELLAELLNAIADVVAGKFPATAKELKFMAEILEHPNAGRVIIREAEKIHPRIKHIHIYERRRRKNDEELSLDEVLDTFLPQQPTMQPTQPELDITQLAQLNTQPEPNATLETSQPTQPIQPVKPTDGKEKETHKKVKENA